ncbi:MAG TPA: Gfo/Idh/MocA family oxidoreductase [Acidobacteriota bacterium]|nr:Gfo/Idh/MocA family oxidoreductase [Acidobacteriota bacterium]
MKNASRNSLVATSNMTRRDFIVSTTGAAAVICTGASLPRGAKGRVIGANDRLGVGFVGVGGRGMSHVSSLIGLINQGENLRIVAVNDAYGPRMDKAAERAKAKTYRTHRELLADKDVDVVCIASPDRLHVPQALDAIRAGKDVYCEKPMGHWSQISQSRELFLETRRLGRVVQIGNQGNSSSAWRKVGELLQKGTIGKVQHVQAGYFRLGDWGERMPIPDPNAKPGPDLDWEAFLGDAPKVPYDVRRFFSWRMFLDYAGGPCTDLFPHVFTPFVSLLGLKFPSLVATSGGIFKYDDYGREVPDTFNMCIDYPEKLSVVLVCTLANQHMTEPAVRGDQGTITLQNVVWETGFDSVTVHPPKGDPTVIKGEMPNSTLAHWRNFLACVHSREKPVSDVEFGYHVQAVLCMAMQGFLKRQTAKFDAENGQIVL